ncbi:hypothetical protein CP49_36730 [Bradyrhizobium valentinum]|uniref:Uncharacterized protein n=1 Tax=Bradyrhizobium valentinum TaxID=1518501 RepID=A0A0R3L8X1_9BRAD|nr:hypothetical protein CP49_36730 [Bradyrhizobium valentinum]
MRLASLTTCMHQLRTNLEEQRQVDRLADFRRDVERLLYLSQAIGILTSRVHQLVVMRRSTRKTSKSIAS